jgi:hypothetical protein
LLGCIKAAEASDRVDRLTRTEQKITMGTEENPRSAGGISSGESRGENRSDRKKYKEYKETHHDGGNPELWGHIYTFGVPGQADKYRKTTEAIADYVGQKMMNEMWALVQNGKEGNFPEPKDPGDKHTAVQMEKYKMQFLRMLLDMADQYKSDKAKVFRLIIGQECIPAMKHKVEGDPKYPLYWMHMTLRDSYSS